METFEEFLANIEKTSHRERLEEIFNWLDHKYPQLEKAIKWNQPMYTDHGTFIIAFSVAKKHMSVAPEAVTIKHLEEDIKKAGYDYTKQIIRIPWKSDLNYSLLEKMIEFNIEDKAEHTSFWRN
ncbi:iron chaperone [Aquisalibacillus elongatus]|uniref:YdhG-like domain-containing protein n=1 Tax=Aquisalibacillus elongatus TaxID=485577 RepID=A0A3N5B520_9BACI|nr:iron chaperone [Aquisalibacillus elongatus]RPF50660.1 hypothetical protein EDC24_2629 [Aquisalibacillus elongatus]